MIGFAERPRSAHRLNHLLHRVPPWLRPYVIASVAFTGALGIAVILAHTVGTKSTLVYSLLGDLLVLGCAWLGYGPGILICTLTTFLVPPALVRHPAPVDAGRFATLIIICLLISRISTSKRRTEASLRQLAKELDIRVYQRTLELKQNEEKLASLAAIVQWSEDAIIGQTLDGAILSWNRGAEALFGYSDAEAIGQSIRLIYPPRAAEEVESILSRVCKGEVIQHSEGFRLTKNGEERVVSVTVSPVRDSGGAICGASTVSRDITAERRARQALEDSERRYRVLFDNNPQPMWVYDTKTLAFLAVNNTAIQHYGFSREEFLRMTLADIRPAEEVSKLLEATAIPPGEYRFHGRWRHKMKNGQVITVEIAEHPLEFGGRSACLVLATDVTERFRLEEQMRQAQRLESIGRLAGGVAHDFNNLLTVINGYTEMLLLQTAAGKPSFDALTEIREAGNRAAGLTAQLLAFSRKQVLQLSVFDLNTVVRETGKLLRRLIGENIELIMKLSPDLGLIRADPGQMQQIIMNLALNGRDAMPDGGTLLIETANVYLEHDEVSELASRSCISLTVTDSGIGMDAETQAHVFEPFFTTKELGKGTGLGLATVYGMVKQAGGRIVVNSEIGRGTRFRIDMPRTNEQPSTTSSRPSIDLRGHETILIVEDYAEVRALALSGLADYGYSAHGAATGNEALAFCRDFRGPIHLVVTDVVMTDMNGREVADRIKHLRPQTPILFMSGYTADVIAKHGVLEPGVEYLAKPFTPDSLARKVREVLGPDTDPPKAS